VHGKLSSYVLECLLQQSTSKPKLLPRVRLSQSIQRDLSANADVLERAKRSMDGRGRKATNLIEPLQRFQLCLTHPKPLHPLKMSSVSQHLLEMPCLDKKELIAYANPPTESRTNKNHPTHLLLFDQTPCVTFFSCTCSPTNAMHILSHIEWNVVAHDVPYVPDVDPAGDEVGAY